MKKSLKNIVLSLLAIVFLLSSCSIEKRHYLPGYYISGKNLNDNNNNSTKKISKNYTSYNTLNQANNYFDNNSNRKTVEKQQIHFNKKGQNQFYKKVNNKKKIKNKQFNKNVLLPVKKTLQQKLIPNKDSVFYRINKGIKNLITENYYSQSIKENDTIDTYIYLNKKGTIVSKKKYDSKIKSREFAKKALNLIALTLLLIIFVIIEATPILELAAGVILVGILIVGILGFLAILACV